MHIILHVIFLFDHLFIFYFTNYFNFLISNHQLLFFFVLIIDWPPLVLRGWPISLQQDGP